MNISEFCDKLDSHLAARPPGAERYEVAIKALRQAFSLQPDEIAVLSADLENAVLRFQWPLKLQKSGTIPISSRDSLAARTFREKKAVVNNRFADIYHASIFEQIKLTPQATERPRPIQKILSAPLPGSDGTLTGVIQLSRKGPDSNAAGPDFTREDLAALIEISKVLGKHL
jgi:hypothetical protein